MKDEGKSLIQGVGSGRVEKLSMGLLKLKAQAHDELLHASGLLMTTTKRAGICAGKRVSSHHRIHSRSKSVDMAPDATVATVELVDSGITMLKFTEGLV